MSMVDAMENIRLKVRGDAHRDKLVRESLRSGSSRYVAPEELTIVSHDLTAEWETMRRRAFADAGGGSAIVPKDWDGEPDHSSLVQVTARKTRFWR